MSPDQPAAEGPATDHPTPIEMRVYAERLLARREYAALELQTRLVKKWSGEWSGKWPGLEQIEKQVAELIIVLQADGVLSDERFAESFIRSRRQRCHGPVKIQAELRQRQVPAAVIAGKLEQAEDDWVTLAAAWLSRQCPGPLDFASRAKYYRRLMHRGFSHQQAMGALARHSES